MSRHSGDSAGGCGVGDATRRTGPGCTAPGGPQVHAPRSRPRLPSTPCTEPDASYRTRTSASLPHTTSRYREVNSGVQVVSVT